jgi:hypothetical protein
VFCHGNGFLFCKFESYVATYEFEHVPFFYPVNMQSRADVLNRQCFSLPSQTFSLSLLIAVDSKLNFTGYHVFWMLCVLMMQNFLAL